MKALLLCLRRGFQLSPRFLSSCSSSATSPTIRRGPSAVVLTAIATTSLGEAWTRDDAGSLVRPTRGRHLRPQPGKALPFRPCCELHRHVLPHEDPPRSLIICPQPIVPPFTPEVHMSPDPMSRG